MLLCLDIGNTQIHGGVFDGEALLCQFRKSTQPLGSTDEVGIFLVSVLRENGVDPRAVDRVALCSVVPAALHPVRGASKQYFGCEPFVLQAGVKTGLKVRYRNPLEVGADRIAGAIAATQRQPGRNLIVVDCGTATTFDVVTAAGDYLGGRHPAGGGRLGRDAGQPHRQAAAGRDRPARDGPRALDRREHPVGPVPRALPGPSATLVAGLTREVFGGEKPHVLGTGGFARMLEERAALRRDRPGAGAPGPEARRVPEP